MKLSCLPVSLYPELATGRMALGDWLRLAAALGLDGADLSVAHLYDTTPESIAVLRREAEDAAISIVMLASYSDFTQPNATQRAAEVDGVRAWIEVAAGLGASFIRLTAGQQRADVALMDGLQWATEGLMAALPDAEQAGIELLYENHVRGAPWSANDFTQPAAHFLEVVSRTQSSKLGILFDTANNLALHEDPLFVLDAVLARVRALHLSDIRRSGSFEPVLLGTGAAPIQQALERMRANGFDGWISIEEASRTGQHGIQKAIAWARQRLRDEGPISEVLP